MSKLSKILSIVMAVIAVIGFYFFVQIVMKGDDAIKNEAAAQASTIEPFIWFSIVVLGITIGITVLFSVVNIFTNPDNLKKTLIGLASLVIVLVLSYSFASDAAVTDVTGNIIKDGEQGATSKWVGTGLIYSMILGGIGLVLFLFDMVKGMVK